MELSKNFIQDTRGNSLDFKPIIAVAEKTSNFLGFNILWTLSADSNIVYNKGEQYSTRPILDSVSQNKFSVDYEDRIIKISTLRVKIHNRLDEYRKLSDQGGDFNFEGKYVFLFYKTPSTDILNIPNFYFDFNVNDRDCGLIYFGICNKATFNSKIIDIQVEDYIQDAIADKQIPFYDQGNIDQEITSTIPNVYKDKTVPMVFGKNNHSSCLPYVNNAEKMDILVDAHKVKSTHTVFKIPATAKESPSSDFGNADNCVFAYIDDEYVKILTPTESSFNQAMPTIAIPSTVFNANANGSTSDLIPEVNQQSATYSKWRRKCIIEREPLRLFFNDVDYDNNYQGTSFLNVCSSSGSSFSAGIDPDQLSTNGSLNDDDVDLLQYESISFRKQTKRRLIWRTEDEIQSLTAGANTSLTYGQMLRFNTHQWIGDRSLRGRWFLIEYEKCPSLQLVNVLVEGQNQGMGNTLFAADTKTYGRTSADAPATQIGWWVCPVNIDAFLDVIRGVYVVNHPPEAWHTMLQSMLCTTQEQLDVLASYASDNTPTPLSELPFPYDDPWTGDPEYKPCVGGNTNTTNRNYTFRYNSSMNQTDWSKARLNGMHYGYRGYTDADGGVDLPDADEYDKMLMFEAYPKFYKDNNYMMEQDLEFNNPYLIHFAIVDDIRKEDLTVCVTGRCSEYYTGNIVFGQNDYVADDSFNNWFNTYSPENIIDRVNFWYSVYDEYNISNDANDMVFPIAGVNFLNTFVMGNMYYLGTGIVNSSNEELIAEGNDYPLINNYNITHVPIFDMMSRITYVRSTAIFQTQSATILDSHQTSLGFPEVSPYLTALYEWYITLVHIYLTRQNTDSGWEISNFEFSNIIALGGFTPPSVDTNNMINELITEAFTRQDVEYNDAQAFLIDYELWFIKLNNLIGQWYTESVDHTTTIDGESIQTYYSMSDEQYADYLEHLQNADLIVYETANDLYTAEGFSQNFVSDYGISMYQQFNGYLDYPWEINPASTDIIDKPSDIVLNILVTELGFGRQSDGNLIENDGHFLPDFSMFDIESINKSRQYHQDWRMGFNINEKTNGKRLIEGVLSESKSMLHYTRSGRLSFSTIKDDYTYEEINHFLNNDDIFKYKLSRTKREDLTTAVKYAYDYNNASGEYVRNYPDDRTSETTLDISEYFSYYEGYELYNITKEDSLHFRELKYHTDYNTVEKLAEHHLLNNCNQHNIIDAELPLSFANIEIGEIVQIGLLENCKFYGEDYSQMNQRNGQWIYPMWLVTDVAIDLKRVKIKAYQLHYLNNDNSHGYIVPESSNQEQQVYCYFGDTKELTGTTEQICIDSGGEVLTYDDIQYYGSKEPLHSTLFYTNGERSANLLYNSEAIYDNGQELGVFDVMSNGVINIADIIKTVNYVIGVDELTPNQIKTLTTYNLEDGTPKDDDTINVIQIIEMVNHIIN